MIICDYAYDKTKPVLASSLYACDVVNFWNFVAYNTMTGKLDIKQKFFETHLTLKEDLDKAKIKTTFQVGSWDDEVMHVEIMAKVALNSEKTQHHIKNVIDIIKAHNFSGIVLNWRFPGVNGNRKCVSIKEKEKAIVVSYVNAMGKALKAEGKLHILYSLTTDPSINWCVGNYYSKVTDYVDYFIMEGQFQSSVFEPRLTLSTSLKVLKQELATVIENTKAEAMNQKILISLSPLSLNYKLLNKESNTLGSKNGIVHPEYHLSFAKLCAILKQGKVTQVRNIETQHYAYSNSYLFCFDDYDSLEAKVEELVFANNLAGIHIQPINGDDLLGECGCGISPHLRMVAELLKGEEGCKPKSCFLPDTKKVDVFEFLP